MNDISLPTSQTPSQSEQTRAPETVEPLGSLKGETLSEHRQQLYRASERIENLIKEPSSTSPSTAEEIISEIENSVQSLLAIDAYCRSFNQFAALSPDRPSENGADLLPLAAHQIACRAANGTPPPVSKKEQLLLEMFSKKHNGDLVIDKSLLHATVYTDLKGSLDNLPNPETYIDYSDELRSEFGDKASTLPTLRQEYSRMRSSNEKEEGFDGTNTLALNAEIEMLEDELIQALYDNPVDPQTLECVHRAITISVTPSMPILEAANKLHQQLGKLICVLLKTAEQSNQPPCIAPLHLNNDSLSVGADILIKQESLDKLSDEKNLARLTALYADLKQKLIPLLEEMVHKPDEQTNIRTLKSFLNSFQSQLFPGPTDTSAATINALAGSGSAAVKDNATRLFLTNLKIAGSNSCISGSILEQPQNIQLLSSVVDRLIRGSNTEADQLEAELKDGSLKTLVEISANTRSLFFSKNPIGIAKLFDREMKAVLNTPHARYPRLAGIFLAMHTISQDARLSKQTKSFLKEIELCSNIATKLSESTGRSGAEAAAFIEKARATITKNFSVGLKDYLGQCVLVNKLVKHFKESMLLANNPQFWEGLPPNKVIFNGYLLVGEPGVGKTFLVKCITNELNLPLVRITGEELFRTLISQKNSENTSQNEGVPPKTINESGLTELIKSRVEQAERERAKSGAPFVVLFFDELEALFLDRRNLAADAQRVAEVNAMLTAIEEIIAEESKVLCIAATNYLDMMDAAATRSGRFGLILGVNKTSAEDVKGILADCLDFHNIQLNLEDPQYKEALDMGAGLNVLPIQQATHRLICLKRIQAWQAQQQNQKGNCLEISGSELAEALKEVKSFERKQYFQNNLGKTV